MKRCVRHLAGEGLLVKCPDTSLRRCRRKRKGNEGTCRIWPECRCIRWCIQSVVVCSFHGRTSNEAADLCWICGLVYLREVGAFNGWLVSAFAHEAEARELIFMAVDEMVCWNKIS